MYSTQWSLDYPERQYIDLNALVFFLKFAVVTLPDGDFVQQIDYSNKYVITKTGKQFSYQRLCLCHGARPKLIVPGYNPFVIGIRDTESVATFQAKLEKAKRICVVGNGGIATELVYELQAVDIVWAIQDDSISATFVDAGAGEFFISGFNEKGQEKEDQIPVKRFKYTVTSSGSRYTTEEGPILGGALGPDWHNKIQTKGIADGGLKRLHVEYECEVKRILTPAEKLEQNQRCSIESLEHIVKFDKEFEEKEWNIYIELNNGKIFGCDFVVSATGVIPNGDMIQLIDDNQAAYFQLSEDKAIEVNEQMETNITDIYAAGDVCSPKWDHAKHWFQMRLWTQARQMGMFAAQCMQTSFASERTEKKDLDFCFELFAHATKLFGYKLILLGLFNGQKDLDYEVLLRVTKGKEYIKCVMSKDGRMQGAILIGETDLEETFENLILNQMDLTDYGVDLLDPNIDIEDYFD